MFLQLKLQTFKRGPRNNRRLCLGLNRDQCPPCLPAEAAHSWHPQPSTRSLLPRARPRCLQHRSFLGSGMGTGSGQRIPLPLFPGITVGVLDVPFFPGIGHHIPPFSPEL